MHVGNMLECTAPLPVPVMAAAVLFPKRDAMVEVGGGMGGGMGVADTAAFFFEGAYRIPPPVEYTHVPSLSTHSAGMSAKRINMVAPKVVAKEMKWCLVDISATLATSSNEIKRYTTHAFFMFFALWFLISDDIFFY